MFGFWFKKFEQHMAELEKLQAPPLVAETTLNESGPVAPHKGVCKTRKPGFPFSPSDKLEEDDVDHYADTHNPDWVGVPFANQAKDSGPGTSGPVHVNRGAW